MRAVLQRHDGREGEDAAERFILRDASGAQRRLLAPGLAVVLADHARNIALQAAGEVIHHFVSAQGRLPGEDPQAILPPCVGETVDDAALEVDVVGRHDLVDPPPGKSCVVAARHRAGVAAVADVPDTEDRPVVRQHCRGRMSVIGAGLGRTAGDDNLPRRVFGEIEVLQRPAVSLPQRLLVDGRGGPRALRRFRGQRHLGLREIARFVVLGTRDQRRDQQGDD